MPAVRVFRTSAAPAGTLEAIRRLLDDAFDGAFSEDDWQHSLGGWHALIEEDGEALAHAAVVPRLLEFGQRRLTAGYVESVGTAPSRQGEGLGSRVMAAVNEVVRREFDVGVLSTGRQRFYARLGWERWRGPTFVRRDGRLERSEEEDHGIMVLRCDASLDLRMTDRIVCEARRGDDW